MRRPMEVRIKEAFASSYEPPGDDLRQMLARPAPSPRHQRRRLARLGAFALVAVLVAVAISAPRALRSAPTSAPSRSFPQVYPDYGYLVVATKQDLSGKGGKFYLGSVPSDRSYGVTLQTSCASRQLTPFTKTLAGGQRVHDLVAGVEGSSGPLAIFVTTSAPRDRPCSANDLGGGSSLVPAETGSGVHRLNLYVLAAKGIAWRVTIEVYGRLGSPPHLPATLGACPSAGLGWGTIGPPGGAATKLSLAPSGSYPPHRASCQLVLPVRLGLFWAGTTSPLPIAGNPAEAQLSGPYDGGPTPSESWIWTNWCGSRRPVQAVFFGPRGAVLLDQTSGVKLPSCEEHSRPSTLTVQGRS